MNPNTQVGTMNNPKDMFITEDEPLIVLKFQKRRMLWRFFFGYSIWFLLCFYLMALASSEKLLKFLFFEFIFATGFILALYTMVDMFLMKDIRLYKNRITQRFKLFKKERVIYLNNAKYNATQTFYFTFMAISPMDRRWNKILFDPRLIETNEKIRFYKVLSELTGRPIVELKKTFLNVRLMKAG